MCPADAVENTDSDEFYTLDEYSTVTVANCPFCGQTHLFSIEPGWETIQKAKLPQQRLPANVKKFIVECPIQHSLFEIFVRVK